MEDNRWLRRIMIRSLEGIKRRGRPEIKWEREVESVIKQKNLTPQDAVNRQLRLKATENQ
jgi:hypothetical protein